MFRLLPRDEKFFDLVGAPGRPHRGSGGAPAGMVFDFSDAPAKAAAIRELIVVAWILTLPICGIIEWGVTKRLLLAQ